MTYRLVGTTPVPCEMRDVEIGTNVCRQWVTSECHVSTSFLGIDHNFSGEGGPILFETLVQGGPADSEQVRYRTWDEAFAGHMEMVTYIRSLYANGPGKLTKPDGWVNGEEI